MSHLKTQCPQCQKNLKLAGEPREGKRVSCPKCGHRFVPAPANDESAVVVELLDEATPAVEAPTTARRHPGPSPKPLILAAVGSLLFVGICIAAALVYTQSNGGKPVAQQTSKPAPPPPPTQEDAKEKARREEEKRRAEFDKCMADGNTALADQHYEDAAKAYAEALRLFPQNVDAAKGAAEAKTRLAALTKDKQDADRKLADFARLMDAGKEAMTGKKYAQAVRSFENALQVMAGQADAIKALDEAKEKLAADTEEKKKLADYEKFMAAGRAAITAGRYPDAIRDFAGALALLPNDATALEGRRMAEKRITDEINDEKRRDSYFQAMKLGDANMKAKKFKDAAQSYEFALKLYPDEKDAQQALKQAKDGMNSGINSYNALMAQGNVAGLIGRWGDAVAAYSEAVKLFPDNVDANRALQNAQVMMQAAMQSAQVGQAAYLSYMNAAVTAMQLRRWADAVANYTQALRLVPTSADAALGLQQAEINLALALKNRTAFNQAIDRAATAYQQGRYADAVRAYQDALAIDPDSRTATNGLHQARYSQYMGAGDADLRAKKYNDAVRDYENALREVPGDPAATRAWQQARALSTKK